MSIDGNRYVDLNPTENWYGTSEVTIQVSDGDLVDSDRFTVTVLSVNDAPMAQIDAISPSPALPGNQISFLGTGTDIDSNIVAWEWRSDLDGLLSSSEDFDKSSDTLTIGTHVISFRVQDSEGLWSQYVTQTLVNLLSDTEDPTATLTNLGSPTIGSTTLQFTITYEDNVAIDVSTLDHNDIRITGPNGYDELATFVSVDNSSNGSPRVATYQVNAPGGTWNTTDNGAYTISMQTNQVSDVASPANVVIAGSLRAFNLSLVIDLDFGDAPAPYATTLAENGARHVVTGPTLGTHRDSETDVTHSVAADADDTTSAPDDEDGVTFGTIQVGQLDATVTVNVQNAPSGAKLDAWIDFNADGSWGGTGERIFASQDVVVGDNILAFDVPSWAIAGETYVRFRLSSTGLLAPSGLASDGEVEDYQATINSASGTGVFTDSGQSPGDSSSMGVSLGDLDGDGDLDAFVANWGNQANRVWFNNGLGTFIDSGQSLGLSSSVGVSLADLDSDNDLDAFVANYDGQANKVWLNDGTGSFIDSGNSLGSSWSICVSVGDFDGDGDLDAFVTNEGQANKVWFNDGSGVFTDSGTGLGDSDSVCVSLGDLDGDGDLDAVVANWDSANANKVWLNNGSGTFTDSGQNLGSLRGRGVSLGDLDGDGDLDAFVANDGAANRIWLNNGLGFFTDSGNSLGGSTSFSVFLGDVDGDGDLDAFVTNSGQGNDGDGNKVWLNNGSGVFADSGSSLGSSASFGVSLGDVDGDGDLDAFVANWDHPSKVWLNQNQDLDFGDAPAPYATTLAEEGARHEATGPTLGTNRDSETDGTHSAAADADDTIGTPDDEDGVTFGTIQVGRVDCLVMVNVQGESVSGKLDAWIDFNGDGSWGGPGEQIFASQDVVSGNNVMTFEVPSWAIAGNTYARFRLSSAGQLAPGGFASDGEVEDYRVTITEELVEDHVAFADINLKAAVETALGTTDPTPTDMLILTSLYANSLGVEDLEGLQYATNLTKLWLGANRITDVSTLSSLVNLEYLTLHANRISDLSGLSYLANLGYLGLGSNQITDLSGVSGLTTLTMLTLRGNQITNLAGLSGLSNLNKLYIEQNQISDLSPLSALTNLRGLRVDGNLIGDLSPLASLAGLTELNAMNNQISDLSPLSGLTNLALLPKS